MTFIALALFVFVTSAWIAPAAAGAQSACKSADSVSTALIETLLRYSTATTATSPGDVAVRDSLKLPKTSQVALVTSTTVCSKAKTAFETEFASKGTGLSSQVYVVSVGNTYAIVDAGFRYGGYPNPAMIPFVFIVDSKYKKLSIFSG